MKNLIKIEKEEMFVSLATIVKFTNNPDKSVKELIRKNKADLILLGLSYKQGFPIDDGEDLNYSELIFNEDVSTYLITLMQNTPKVKKFKFDLVVNFRQARKIIKDSICETNKLQIAKKETELKQKETQLLEAQKVIADLQKRNGKIYRGGLMALSTYLKDREINLKQEEAFTILETKGIVVWKKVYSDRRVLNDETFGIQNNDGVIQFNSRLLDLLFDLPQQPTLF